MLRNKSGQNEKMKRWDHLTLRTIITLCALIIAFIHIMFPEIKIDVVALALIIFAAVPWLAPLIKSIELAGVGRVELQEVKDGLAAVQKQVKQNNLLQGALRDAIFYRLQKQYTEAEAAYKKALYFDPDSAEAEIGVAVTMSYISSKNLDDSIKILTNVISKNPNSSKAYYNRACIRALLKDDLSKQLWLDDLKKAIEIDPIYREYAKKDKDFEKYWDDPAFLATIR